MTMTKSIEEQANEYATGGGATIEKRKCFTVDLHLGNPQQYEYVKIYNNDAYCGFVAGAKVRDVQWLEVVSELREALRFYADKNNWLRDAKGWRHDMIIKDLDDESLNDWEGRFSGKISRQSLIKADQMLKEMGIK